MNGIVTVVSLLAWGQAATAFVVPAAHQQFQRQSCAKIPDSSVWRWAVAAEDTEKSSSSQEQAALLRAQAEQMRLEAEKMDISLTLQKIDSLERKLTDPKWLARHPEEEQKLQQQLSDLKNRLQGKPPRRVVYEDKPVKKSDNKGTGLEKAKASESTDTKGEGSSTPKPHPPAVSSHAPDSQYFEGFSPEDLELYIPVAEKIEKMLSTATPTEKLEAFRTAPELHDHFEEKIQQLLVGPMEDMQQLESLKGQYLNSNSSKEKEQLKRQIDRLEKALEEESPFVFSDSVYREIPELSEEELEKRVEAIEKLPGVLQSLYKKRHEVDEDGDLRLAIKVEHYESQIQLLDQVPLITPLTEEYRRDAIRGYESLPPEVQDHFAEQIGLKPGSDAKRVLKELEGGDAKSWGPAIPFQPVVEIGAPELPEYGDVEFLDRSRYIEELFPAFARMEPVRPTPEEMEAFCAEVLDKSTYSLTGKPERVMGGYYLRGELRIQGENANDVLVERLQERLAKSSMKDRLQFFFIPDPTLPTDEDVEMGNDESSILAVTSIDPVKMYSLSRPPTKALVSLTGLFGSVVYALGACGMNPATLSILDDQLQEAAETGTAVDPSFLIDMFVPTLAALLGIQVVHELAHRLVAWKDGIQVGLPNLIPSIQLGLTGAITPLLTPPKNYRSLFDFSIAGPLAGFFTSFGLLFVGVLMTASMDMSTMSQLPAMPALLLKSSALGGEMIEYFLGSGVLSSSNVETAVLPLHPFAIAGFAGLISNALALLPLGNTDGGRVSLCMFGRRGAFLVKSISVLFICSVGLFGLDGSQIMLLYALFCVLWQRELEGPVRNEVDELDISRGFLGIGAFLLVALTLTPIM